ncbi:MAG: hypothetical protein FJ306_13795 [Planctomycetes bacterium]|nr:hypothetical protein [Planctomycetota bacterium]
MPNLLRRVVVLLPLLLAVACTGEATAPAAAPAPAAPVAATAEMTAKLAKADAKDGAVDQCVHRCAGCALGMDGKATMPLQVGAYTMHFCKQACLDCYAKDAAGELAKLKVD